MRLIRIIKNKIEDINYNRKIRKERRDKGYSWVDVCDIGKWFINIIPKMIQELKDISFSYPCVFDDEFIEKNKDIIDDPIALKNGYCDNEELTSKFNEYCLKRWNEVLDRMIFLFNESDEDNCSLQNKYEEEMINRFKVESKRKPSIYSIDEIHRLWREEDEKIQEYREKCKKEAIDLFVKYCRGCWSGRVAGRCRCGGSVAGARLRRP